MKDQKKSTPISVAELAKMIDHTVLKADASKEAVLKLCREAAEYEFGAVCVNSCWVDLCVKTLKGSDVKTASVVGFPLGAMSPKAKQDEAADALQSGAKELDMVINIGFLKSGMLDEVTEDIKALADLAHKKDAILKVIIETSLLNDEEKVLACQLAVKAGADYVKTSTGFSTAGATPEDVELMRKTVGSKIGVKASGGIRTYADAMRMIEAGASRIGCSAGAQILKEAREAQG